METLTQLPEEILW